MILKNYTSVLVRKERLHPTSKAKMKASQNKFIERSEMPDRVKNLREVGHSKNHPRAQLGFATSI